MTGSGMRHEVAQVRMTGPAAMRGRRRRGALWVCLALAGGALAAQAARATTPDVSANTSSARARAATSYIGSVPPSAADRRGLLRAFRHVHSARSRVLLVGFRECCVFSNTPGQVLHSAAAYVLTAGENGSYGSAAIELYRRAHGDTWVHVARFKNTTPDWNDAYNLGAGFLWRVIADGTGTYDNRITVVATDGSYTDLFASHVNFTWSLVFKGSSFTPGAENGLNAPRSLAGQASASVTYSETPEQNASCTGRVKDTSTDGSPNMAYAEFPQDGPTKALDFTVQLTGGSNLNWPATCDSTWSTFPDADRLLVGARMPIAVARRTGIYELGGDHGPDMHAQPFSYPVDDFAPPVVKQATPHQSSRENDGDESSTTTEDLRLAGTLHFRLVGLFMPLGESGLPHGPVRGDGHVPPVL
jgi:hypothetical protein